MGIFTQFPGKNLEEVEVQIEKLENNNLNQKSIRSGVGKLNKSNNKSNFVSNANSPRAAVANHMTVDRNQFNMAQYILG